jgi:hypothetical protein
LTFSILLIVCLICSVPGATLANRWFGRAWRGLGVLPTLIVLLPLARMFDNKHKELRVLAGEAPSDTAACAECDQMFRVQDMISHNGHYVCARCKPVFLQKLAEGAKIGSAPEHEKSY